MRHYSLLDRVIHQADKVIHLHVGPIHAFRPSPAEGLKDGELSPAQQQQVIALMRVNHAGEIAAQGLYQGQALSAETDSVRQQMEAAADEEIDHLAWCRQRLDTLGGRPSYLDPLWYLGSVAIGATAGWIGDRWSLGFIAETERQVSHHLQGHLARLPANDTVSAAILSQMQREEQQHAQHAIAAGAHPLPRWVQGLMRLTSKIMVTTATYF